MDDPSCEVDTKFISGIPVEHLRRHERRKAKGLHGSLDHKSPTKEIEETENPEWLGYVSLRSTTRPR